MSKGLVQYRELDVRELVRRTEEEAKNLGENPIQIYLEQCLGDRQSHQKQLQQDGQLRKPVQVEGSRVPSQ